VCTSRSIVNAVKVFNDGSQKLIFQDGSTTVEVDSMAEGTLPPSSSTYLVIPDGIEDIIAEVRYDNGGFSVNAGTGVQGATFSVTVNLVAE